MSRGRQDQQHSLLVTGVDIEVDARVVVYHPTSSEHCSCWSPRLSVDLKNNMQSKIADDTPPYVRLDPTFHR